MPLGGMSIARLACSLLAMPSKIYDFWAFYYVGVMI
jgi:hypothetical protein